MQQEQFGASLPVSCLPVSLFSEFSAGTLTLAGWAEFARTLGLDSVDVNARFLPQVTPDVLAAEREKLALPVKMVTTYSDFTNPSREARRDAVALARSDIAAAGALGAGYIRLTAGQYYAGADEGETVEWIADCFAACIPAAEAAGVRVLLENHSRPGAWTADDFDFALDRMARLWERMKTLPVGVNYDTANAYALGDWGSLVRLFAGRIETVHLNDVRSVTPLRYCCIGDGIVPLSEQLEAVIRTGFDGPVCVEEAGMRGREGIERSIRYTKDLTARLRRSV